MQLSEYLKDAEKSQAEFARDIGEKPQTVGRYVAGKRKPEEDVMRKIFNATGGKVTANDFYGLPANPPKIEVGSAQ